MLFSNYIEWLENCYDQIDDLEQDHGNHQEKKLKELKQTHQVEGLVQNCSNSSVLAMELLHSCTKPSM